MILLLCIWDRLWNWRMQMKCSINRCTRYSIALLSAVPRIGQKMDRIILQGDVPSPIDPKPGCRFAPRCWMAKENCLNGETPELCEVSPGHFVACPYAKEAVDKWMEISNNSF